MQAGGELGSPVQALIANPYAECLIGSIRRECLDHLTRPIGFSLSP